MTYYENIDFSKFITSMTMVKTNTALNLLNKLKQDGVEQSDTESPI